MTDCVLCHKEMGTGTKPRYVIDWEKLKVLGKAHTGCVKKQAKYQDTRYYPETEPTTGEIAFSKLLKEYMDKVQEENLGKVWDKKEFHKYLLASEALFKVATREEWYHLPRVKELTDWWLTGSYIISQKEYDSIFEWIASFNTHETRPQEVED